MIVDYSLEHYQGILSQVIKWRAVPLMALQDLSGYQGTRRSFYRVIRNLEDRKLIKTCRFNGKAKIVTPTRELAILSPFKHADLQEDSLTHEAIVSIICRELLTWEIFNSVTLPHEIITKSYDSGIRRLPDAVIEGINNGRPFKLALEIEITRKSKIRVQNKVEDYLKNDVFDFVFYVFNDKSTFEAYQRFIIETIQRPQFEQGRRNHEARFILGHKSRMIEKMCKLDDLELFYRGQFTSLASVFGNRRPVT